MNVLTKISNPIGFALNKNGLVNSRKALIQNSQIHHVLGFEKMVWIN